MRWTPLTQPNLKASAPHWLATKFYRYTTALHYDTFTPDEFRESNLYIYLEDPSKQVGSFFGGCKQKGWMERCGYEPSRVPSNNRRENKRWRWTMYGITELNQR